MARLWDQDSAHYVRVPLAFNVARQTFSCWFNATTFVPNVNGFPRLYNGTDHRAFFNLGSGLLVWTRDFSTTAATWQYTHGANIVTNTWYSLVVIWDDDTLDTTRPTVILNGVDITNASGTAYTAASGTPTHSTNNQYDIGNRSNLVDRSWAGGLQDVAWHRGNWSFGDAQKFHFGRVSADQIQPNNLLCYEPLNPFGTPSHRSNIVGTRPSVGPFVIYRPRKLLLANAVAGGGQTVAVGQASETDSALAVGRLKLKAVGQATETDSALAATARRTQAAGLASETDTALAVTGRKVQTVGLASESDAALAVTGRKVKAVGLASETDEALPVSSGDAVQVGLATETDAAFAVTAKKLRSVGLTTESDTALGATAAKRQAVGLAGETDTAPAATARRALGAGVAIEIDLAQAIAAAKVRSVGLASETDAALALVPQGLIVAVGLAVENDEALNTTYWKARPAAARSGGAVTVFGGSSGTAAARGAGTPATGR